MRKNPDPGTGMTISDYFSESWKTVLRLKIHKFFDAGADPESFWPWIRDRKIRIRDKHTGSATRVPLVYGSEQPKSSGSNQDLDPQQKCWRIIYILRLGQLLFQAKVEAREEIDLPPSYSDYEEEESEEENQSKDSHE